MYNPYEVQAVKDLGERIGYGNVMIIASALWAKNLKNKYGIEIESTGAFVPAALLQLKKRDKEDAIASLRLVIDNIKDL
jgi:hypothetical protein